MFLASLAGFLIQAVFAHSRLRPAPLPPWTQCTDYSFAYPGWIVEGFELQTPGSLRFRLTNTAINFEADCFHDSVTADQWFECGPPFPGRNLSTHVMFNAESKQLSINQTWRCPELSQDNPYVLVVESFAEELMCGTESCLKRSQPP